MKRIGMVCVCISLLVGTPFTALAASPKSFVSEYRKVAPTLNGDPDGPYAGGLDDITDWANLVNGIGFLFSIGGGLITLLLVDREQQSHLTRLLTMVFLPFNVRWAFFAFTEAFDRRDVDGDGC